MSKGKYQIGIVPMGKAHTLVVKIVAANIEAHLNFPTKIFPPARIPGSAFDVQRRQYNAALLLTSLETRSFSGCRKVVCITDIDLFVPIFTHVYGESRQGGNVAMVSLCRLAKNPDGSRADTGLFYERAAKVALHEIGHLLNLFHCNDNTCLMHFSAEIADLDDRSFYFCRYCSAFLGKGSVNS